MSPPLDGPPAGHGVDRTQFQELLALTPAERLESLRRDVAGLDRLDRAISAARSAGADAPG